MSTGVLPGTVVSHTLYIYCHDLPTTDAYLSTYTDDTMIAAQRYDLGTPIIQTCVDVLTDWFSKWKLTLDKNRSKIIHSQVSTTQ